MDNIRKKVGEEAERGWIGPNTECDYHCCHFSGQDCTFCYCPFYPCGDEKLGKYIESRRGKRILDCSDCLFIHRTEVGKYVMERIREKGFENCGPEEMRKIFLDAKEKYWRRGKALMVLGATSDAGKSYTVAALCRILHRRGLIVAPFKSQNMSLNARVTRKGYEIAMAQYLQAVAAGLKNPDEHMNPILMKPMGDTKSQVMVEGRFFANYDVESYYGEFVPGPGTEAVKRNIDFLLDRYDTVVMEGAGSPAEINIYDRDIANMKAAELADADCILVVNAEWGGSFAYAVGTIDLIPEKDRRRIKGILINNVRGDTERMRPGAEELEKITGIPVLGIIPHGDAVLPSEDSERFRGSRTAGNGKIKIATVKFPRIANFTDLDSLILEDVTVVFAETPEDFEDADAVIIPGTKNTVSDLLWMKETGIAEKITELKGKIPVLGICGGYQMMGKVLSDPEGIEGLRIQETEGLGFFESSTVWKPGVSIVSQCRGTILPDGGMVTGFETHAGITSSEESPLFKIEKHSGDVCEGSVREDEMLFGTYLHGVFESKDFRRYFLSFAGAENAGTEDYSEYLNKNLDKLADVFENALDMDALMKLAVRG